MGISKVREVREVREVGEFKEAKEIVMHRLSLNSSSSLTSLSYNSTAAGRLYVWLIADIKDEMQGLRSSRNRSLLMVNEDFENEHNAAVRLYIRY